MKKTGTGGDGRGVKQQRSPLACKFDMLRIIKAFDVKKKKVLKIN